MARHESDREDLMREATALVRRVELDLDGEDEPVFAGYRANGAVSIYFGPDPVYHFDDELRLRRAYVDGLLYRTQGTTLARLRRERTDEATVLERHDLADGELQAFLRTMHDRLSALRNRLEKNAYRVVAQIPDSDSVPDDLLRSLTGVIESQATLAPTIPGRR